MNAEISLPYRKQKIHWLKPELRPEDIRKLNQRSDLQGLLQSLGFLAVLFAAGYVSYLLIKTRHWILAAAMLYIYGGLIAFKDNAIHELIHNTVFRSKWMNQLFTTLYGLLFFGSNPQLYRMSHRHHHHCTLYRLSDGEEVHPRPFGTKEIIISLIHVIDLKGFFHAFYSSAIFSIVPAARNRHLSDWQKYTFAAASPTQQKAAVNMARWQLLLHLTCSVFFLYRGDWAAFLLSTAAPFYGGRWYQYLINNTQHVGMQPEVADYRRNSRSIRLDPVSSFLYWHMEYHLEHHSYASIPCYHLRELSEKIRTQVPERHSLFQTIRELIAWTDNNRQSRKKAG